jgi:hypothetical protein
MAIRVGSGRVWGGGFSLPMGDPRAPEIAAQPKAHETL